MKPWKTLQSKELYHAGFFRLRQDECELGDGRIMPRYYVVEFPDWVHVVAMTKSRELIMVRQYRHAGKCECLELPGGSLDPRHPEDPLAAAQRELLEETGYASSKWRRLGAFYPNPALQSNQLITFFAEDCEKVSEPNLDPFEELQVEIHKWDSITNMLAERKFQHALVAASLSLLSGNYDLKR